jgi:hypothetical protein
MTDTPHDERSASDAGHGTHGKGDAREELDSPSRIEPPTRRQEDLDSADQATGELANGQWGSAGSGGSVVDKRPDKSRG